MNDAHGLGGLQAVPRHEGNHGAYDVAVNGADRVVSDDHAFGAFGVSVCERLECPPQHFLCVVAYIGQVRARRLLCRPVVRRAFRDIQRLVAQAFEIRHQPKGSGEKSQVVRNRLT